MQELQCELQTSLNELAGWCNENEMSLNSSKTKSMVVGTRQKLQKHRHTLDLKLTGESLIQVKHHKLLGITIDDHLSWQLHINNICKTISRNIFLLSKLKHVVSYEAKRAFFFAHILSHVNYVSNVFDECANDHMLRLQSLHKRAVKQVMSKSNTSYNERCVAMRTLPLKKQLLYNKGLLVHKIKSGKVPAYLLNIITDSHRVQSDLGPRNETQIYPDVRIDLFKCSLKFSGAKAWSECIPPHLKRLSPKSFKTKFFEHLLKSP